MLRYIRRSFGGRPELGRGHNFANMNTISPELAQELKKHPFPDSGKLRPTASPLQLRAARATHLAGLRHLYPIPGPIPEAVKEKEHLVKVRDGKDIRIMIYTPTKPSSSGSPLIVMFHEGGWCMGDLTDEALNCRMFSRDLGAVCVNVEYRLAPEASFPTGVNDSWDVLKWCAQEASPTSSLLPADPSIGFIVGGASAGGNISAVLCQIGRDEGLQPPLTGQYLCVPALLSPKAVPDKWKGQYRSRTEAVSDPILKLAKPGSTSATADALKPDVFSPLYSPLLHENLSKLPAAFFQLCGLDPLKDEGVLYEKLLREDHGTRTKVEIYEGFGHMFWTNWPLMRRSTEFVNDTLVGVQWLLTIGSQEDA
jgi:acetyl esterase/lipase